MSPLSFKTPSRAAFILAQSFEALAADMRQASSGDLSDIAPTAELHHWSTSFRTVPILSGLGAGYNWLEKREVHTSQLFFIDAEAGLARTFSRWYRLGPLAQSTE